jgi:hypothetical protein
MDATRFDALARSLTAAGSRRQTLVTALSGALGLLRLAHPDDAAAAKSGKCKTECDPLCQFCKKGRCRQRNGKKVCKKGRCKPLTDGTPCSPPNGATCQEGVCTCPGGFTVCSGVCKDLKTNKLNCGTCGTACPANQDCLNGACGCAAGQELCGSACYSPCASPLQLRESDHCECCFLGLSPGCTIVGGNPTPSPLCCSLLCLPAGPGPTGICAPGADGTPCNVNEHCASDNCNEDHLCAP